MLFSQLRPSNPLSTNVYMYLTAESPGLKLQIFHRCAVAIGTDYCSF